MVNFGIIYKQLQCVKIENVKVLQIYASLINLKKIVR